LEARVLGLVGSALGFLALRLGGILTCSQI